MANVANDITPDELSAIVDSWGGWCPEEIPVFTMPHVLGWPDNDGKTGGGCVYTTLSAALTTRYRTDVHTAAYFSPMPRRLKYEALGLTKVLMVLAIFDIDCLESHRAGGGPAPDSWFESERVKLELLQEGYPGALIYRTKGGYRIVYMLPVPVEITDEQQAKEVWTVTYLQWCAHLKRVYEITVDTACAEFNRMYRLPHATREGSTSPEDREIIGDPNKIGAWKPDLTAEDIANGVKSTKKYTKLENRLPGTSDYSGSGLFYELFKGAGLLLERDTPTKWFVTCPKSSDHGKTGPTDTFLNAPHPGFFWGHVHCSHSSHNHHLFTGKDWMACFTQQEIDAAKVRCGLDQQKKDRVQLPTTIDGELTLGQDEPVTAVELEPVSESLPEVRFDDLLRALPPYSDDLLDSIDTVLGSILNYVAGEANDLKRIGMIRQVGAWGLGVRAITARVKAITAQAEARVARGQIDPTSDRWYPGDDLPMKKGRLEPIRYNVEQCLRNSEELKGLLYYDELGGEVVFAHKPPWEQIYKSCVNTKVLDPWTDSDDHRLDTYLWERYKLVGTPVKQIQAAVEIVAREKSINPVQEYLKAVAAKYDRQERLTTWLSVYMGCEDSPFTRLAGKWWLKSAVARAFTMSEAGVQVDTVLVFEGDQGLGKSENLRTLFGKWFSEADLGDLKSKESALLLAGVWGLDLAEGDLLTRASTRAQKSFLTKRWDDIIPKYSNRRTRRVRRCVFSLTINDRDNYLLDPTGNRRYLPVTVVRKCDRDALARDLNQLWAEAYLSWQQEPVWWETTDEEKALCLAEQAEREVEDSWEEQVKNIIADKDQITVNEILKHEDSPAGKADRNKDASTKRVARCLRTLGWTRGKKPGHGIPRVWTRGVEAGVREQTSDELLQSVRDEVGNI